MTIPGRGLSNIRTLSGRVEKVSLPYRSYMQITCLEMERTRRDRERKSASERIAAIDARLKQIDTIKQELLKVVSPGGGALPSRVAGLEVKPEPRRSVGGFKIRY